MSKKRDEFQLPPGLVNLPPGVLERARRALPKGASTEELTGLVVEALEHYLGQVGLNRGRPESESRPPGNFRLSFTSLEAPGPATFDEPRPREFESTAVFRISPDETTLEELGGVEGTTRQVLIDSFERIGEFERSLTWADSKDATEAILRKVGSWGCVEAVRSAAVRPDGQVGDPERERPIFGFHNRDYPSLWALGLLAEATVEGPVLWSEFAFGLNLVARKFGGLLRGLDRAQGEGKRRSGGLRFATSFPDPSKPIESGGGQWLLSPNGERRERLFPFVKNNVARIQRSGGKTQAVGPLPQWRAIAFFPEGRDFRVGVTNSGLELLEATEGTSIYLPHPATAATAFLDYIEGNSPEDWQGFRRVLRSIAERPDRHQLVLDNREFFDSFREKPTDPKDLRFASTMTQGYVSRGREWGLIAPDLAPSEGGKRTLYRLTELGEDLVESKDWGRPRRHQGEGVE